MLTLSCTLHYLLKKSAGHTEESQKKFSHPFKTEKYRNDNFPQSAQFLDFQWLPEGLTGQFRGVMSGLKPLKWDCLLQVDPRCFAKEVGLKKALVETSKRYRSLVTAGLGTRLDAQRELLDLILENLDSYHKNDFEVTKEFVKVNITNKIFR